jgi:Calx-beta domain
LTFNPNQTTKSIKVPIVDDALDEAVETFKVNLFNASGATILDSVGVGSIKDDDPAPRFLIDDVTVTESNTGQVTATFHLTLSAVSGRPVTVTYKTADGTATAGSDYVARPSTTLTFNPGQTSKTITVLVNGDTVDEPNETFKVVLQTATNAALPDIKGVGTITDNDPLPVLRIEDAPAANEGDLGTHAVLFKVTLSGATQRTVTVNYATGVGTATAGSDYNAASGTFTFLPGQTSKNVAVQVQGDTTVEPNETIKVNLSGATFATIADSQGLHTILNDDGSE